jgi:biopolymer transport protein ExbD
MAMNLGSDSGEDEVNATINTTPLVDVMLVMLIIFLITIPVVIKEVPGLVLPTATNIVTVTKPENITIEVDKQGHVYWNAVPVADYTTLLNRLKVEAVKVPQPEVHVRGDKDTRFEYIGRVIVMLQRASILKVGFITEPELHEVDSKS